ncbi:MAG: hypothetical protein AAGF86_11165 [Pseudomonadota bacterium]
MVDSSTHDPMFKALIEFLVELPAVRTNDTPSLGVGTGLSDGVWWAKFSLDIDHPLAWAVVQELAYVLNQLSLNDRLPTVFKPVSPPPYLNGGPKDYLSWVIECNADEFSPNDAAEWLYSRLPDPVSDESAWVIED